PPCSFLCPYTTLFRSWIILPFGDRVRDEIIESKQSVAHGCQGGDSPKTFCAAKDWPSAASRSAVCIMLKNRAAILHHQHGDSTSDRKSTRLNSSHLVN